jgi:thiamine pyrophosphate-dependent acetolactate synthase large subunit-like protein
MTVLAQRKTWRRERPANETRRSTDLTLQEQENVRVALRFLAKRHGDYAKLAKAMGAHRETVHRPARKASPVTAGIALRAARVAGVVVEELLAGRWPVEGACPLCGRCG